MQSLESVHAHGLRNNIKYHFFYYIIIGSNSIGFFIKKPNYIKFSYPIFSILFDKLFIFSINVHIIINFYLLNLLPFVYLF
jgi:hypothetical protein